MKTTITISVLAAFASATSLFAQPVPEQAMPPAPSGLVQIIDSAYYWSWDTLANSYSSQPYRKYSRITDWNLPMPS